MERGWTPGASQTRAVEIGTLVALVGSLALAALQQRVARPVLQPQHVR